MIGMAQAERDRVNREIVDRFFDDPLDETHQEDLEKAAEYWDRRQRERGEADEET